MTRLTDRCGGLELFGGELKRSVVKEILRWEGHAELGRLLAKLRSHTSRKAFFDTYAEAIVARHLLSRGCEVRFEIPTPLGKRCDFEVRDDHRTFHLHVKRIDTDRPVRSPRRMLAISSRLRALQRIPRPYVVQARWLEDLGKDQITRLVNQADEFIRRARVGDELKATDVDGRELGGVRIIAPWEGEHVRVTIGLPAGFIDQAPRFRRMMQRAYQQFMPRASNVILICSGHVDDAVDFENALLGSHIERWDAFPPRGKRVAHGRAVDGFWSGQRFAESRLAGWFHFSPDEDNVRSRLWVRRDVPIDAEVSELLNRLFNL